MVLIKDCSTMLSYHEGYSFFLENIKKLCVRVTVRGGGEGVNRFSSIHER